MILAALSFCLEDIQLHRVPFNGVVTDPGGAALPGARVLLLNLNTLESEKLQVGDDGAFHYQITKGEYVLVVASPLGTPCFKPAIREIHIEGGHLKEQLRIPLLFDPKKCELLPD